MPEAPSRAARKGIARRALLGDWDPGAIDRWAAGEPRAAGLLQSLLYDAEERVRWRAAEASGRVAAVRARAAGLEPARETVRRALWLMNDESGGLLWLGPQVVGAVLANVPPLRDELFGVLAGFLEEEPFRAGTRWALWRVAAVRPDLVAAEAAGLAASLGDADPAVRGHAALALCSACGASSVAALAGDGARFTVFDFRDGELRETTVGAVARGEMGQRCGAEPT